MIGNLLLIGAVLMYVIGYIKCMIHLIQCDFTSQTTYAAEIIYGISLLTPFGGIVGWLNLGV